MKFVGGKDFKVDANKEYTEEDDKEFRKFVLSAFYTVGCDPSYSDEKNMQIVADYLKKGKKHGTKKNQISGY